MPFKLNLKHLLFLYLGILLLGSVVPIGNAASDILMDNYTLDIRWDYLLHALIYLPLPVALKYGLGWKKVFVSKGIILISILIPVLFELLQMVIPYRNFNINDMIANCFGVVLGWAFLLMLKKSRLSPKK